MIRHVPTLSLLALVASCTTQTAPAPKPVSDSSRNPDMLAPDLYPGGAVAEKEPVVRYGRTPLVSTLPDSGQSRLGLLSIVLLGHLVLRSDLRKDNMEEIGARTDMLSLDDIIGAQREYIEWLLRTCTGNEDACASILTDDAMDLLASKLRTPLQVQLHLTLA